MHETMSNINGGRMLYLYCRIHVVHVFTLTHSLSHPFLNFHHVHVSSLTQFQCSQTSLNAECR